MKRIVLTGLLTGCLFMVAQAQDTIYINKHQQWVKKEKAETYAVVQKKSTIIQVDVYTMEGKLKETSHYTSYTKQPYDRIKEGISYYYYEDGSIKAEVNYAKGKLQHVKAYYPDGKLQREDSYNKKGVLKTSYMYDTEGKATENKEPWERKPEFPGGNTAFARILKANVKYPEDALNAHITGRVILQFFISKEGKITNPKVVRSASPSLDEEALRVINLLAKRYTWKPGIEQGKEVSVRYTIPIPFHLK